MDRPDYSNEKVRKAAEAMGMSEDTLVEMVIDLNQVECTCQDCTQFGLSVHEEDYV